VQILNNNVAVVHIPNGKQMIVMGRGVAFHKRKGDLINEDNIQKIFEMRSPETVSDLTTLLSNIPLDFITVSYDLIDQVQDKYNFSVESYIYVTLTTHLYAAYRRVLQNTEGVNYLPDLSTSYPQAYQIADEILQGFDKQLNVDFPKYERKSIALHFINAHADKANQKSLVSIKPNRNQKIVDLVEDILIKNEITRNGKNSDDYDRLLIHLKYFVDRLNNNQPETLQISQDMIAIISKEYAAAWKIVDEIGREMNHRLQISLSLTEKSYLAIHIERLL
jgi:transcriptional antiterminator